MIFYSALGLALAATAFLWFISFKSGQFFISMAMAKTFGSLLFLAICAWILRKIEPRDSNKKE